MSQTVPIATSLAESTPSRTVADLISDFGDIPPSRIRLDPPIGTAGEADLFRVMRETGSLFELIDGTIVEKAMGFQESLVGLAIAEFLRTFVRTRRLGWVAMADATMRVSPDQIRVPDVSFIARASRPDGKRPPGAVPTVAPDLIVEVFSKSNTEAELRRKRHEFFQDGTRLCWVAYPLRREIDIYLEPETKAATLTAADTLTGGDVLPGFAVPVADIFADLDD